MNVAIRAADLESDRRSIIDTLSRFLTPLSDDRRFRWLYENNPHGEACAWVAYGADDDTVVGIAAAFPRRIYMNGEEKLSWVLGDFCVDPQYRSLGPALQLQRACLVAAEAAGLAFCYDFPSKSMMAVYKRLGVAGSYHMMRLAKPLRTERKVRQFVKLPLAARGLTSIGNLALSFGRYDGESDDGLTIASHEGKCGKEFTALAGRASGQQGISMMHSAEYLNWRYLENPLCKYELLTVRREETLLGCAVFLQEPEDAILVDLFGVMEETALNALIAQSVRLMAARGVQTVSATVFETHPWRRLLEQQGFRTREVSPLVIYAPSGAGSRNGVVKTPNVFFMYGDRDS